MPRLFVGNFDFEHRLADPRSTQLSATLQRINAELAAVWTAIAEDGDFLWTPESIDPDFFEQLAGRGFSKVNPVTTEGAVVGPVQLCPWGWTDRLRYWANQYGWECNPPPVEAIRAGNSRRFSAGLEREWNIGLPGASEIQSVDRLIEALESSAANSPSNPNESRWVIKAEFSMSGRECVLGHGTELPPQTVNWLRKRLTMNGVVFFEPWIDRVDEVGLQFTIPRSGEPVFDGVTPLLTDKAGAYRGSWFLSPTASGELSPTMTRGSVAGETPCVAAVEELEHRWESAIAVGIRAAERLGQIGYFGPLGIDAVRYRDADGELRCRPLQDVNARYTMGGLTLGFRRLLQPGEVGSWLHVRWSPDQRHSPYDWLQQRQDDISSATRIVATSPFEVAHQPTRHGTLLVVAKSLVDLKAAEKSILSNHVNGYGSSQ